MTPTMRDRQACGCCLHYRPSTACSWYGRCKGGEDGARHWVYSPLVAETTVGRNKRRLALRLKQREMGHET